MPENEQKKGPQVAGDPLTDFPLPEAESEEGQEKQSRFELFWETISQAGLIEPVLRIGTHLVSIVLVLIAVWAMRVFYLNVQPESLPRSAALAAPLLTPTPIAIAIEPELPPFDVNSQPEGVYRMAAVDTTIPTRPRVDVITYTVQAGDTVFGIADKFGLKPETILWGNYTILADNPHRLQTGQTLNILPTDGTYHRWSAGENFRKVAEFYGVDPMTIIEWPGNHFDIFDTSPDNIDIAPSTMLIIPGGRREMVDYGPPRIPRDNPAVARTYGPGFCGVLMDGAIGVGSFIWPTIEHWLSGYDFTPAANHSGIDIAGETGNPIWAVDNGVVVFAGLSNYGYGNLVVVDHGNGWQSLYAHLNDIYVVCGQSVYQGTQIATLGNTGNSSGSHLHFELIYGTVRVNPWDFLP
jgi:LysM repeat protein